MNIWYFHHYATPQEMAGLHRPFELGRYIRKENNIAVFTASYLHYSGDQMIDDKSKYLHKVYDGVDTVFVKTCGYESKIKRVLNMGQYAWGLFSAAKRFSREQWKPDIIVASSPHPFTMLAGLRVAKKYKIPCVCEVRDFWPEVFFMGGVLKEKSIIGKILLIGERYIYEKADTLVFLKEGDHTYITDRKWDTAQGGKIDMNKCFYINNGVDIEQFNRKKLENVYEDAELDRADRFKAIYCGTVRPVNNVGMLLDVAKLTEDVDFFVFGTGNCVAELERRIADENITNVFLKGYVDNKYIPSILSKATINVLNYSGTAYNWSRGNSSNKLFEYLAGGKPTVSTVKMGYDIIERHKCGISVEETSAESVSHAILKIKALSAGEYERMCENAQKAAKIYDIPNLANEYMSVLKTTKNNYGRGR